MRTPLVRLAVDAPCEIHCKLELLQPMNRFKIRGAANAIRAVSPEQREAGLLTATGVTATI